MAIGRLMSWLLTGLLCLAALGCSTPDPETSKAGAGVYGPLTFNHPGADFYFAQDGRFALAEISRDGVIEIHLKKAPFQIGYNGRQLNIALAQSPIAEISMDPHGYKASRLSGPMSGGRAPDSDELLVYTGKIWSDGNTELSDTTSRKAAPTAGFQHAYQINQLAFVNDAKQSLSTARGPIHGYIVVYKQPERRNQDIMPVRLLFK